MAMDVAGPSRIAPLAHCHTRTVRRRALEAGLVEPADPVRQFVTHEDGTTTIRYTSTAPPVSSLSDAALDTAVASILEVFPDFGQRMLMGHLRAQGHRVPQDRIAESYVRVNGGPGIFNGHRIVRRVYRVPGPNSLWHHDGQHGKLFSASYLSAS